MRTGNNTKIWHEEKSVILDCVIGDNCVIHAMVWIGNNVSVGDNCKIQPFTFIPDGVSVGNNCFIGPRVTFTNDKYPPSGGNWLKTIIGNNVVIGAGVIILPGITIGNDVIIGAGAVVTKSISSKTCVVGNPAKQLTLKNK